MHIKWIVGVPDNSNFSFERDTNLDGIADGWTGTSVKCSIISEKYYPHCQEINRDYLTSIPFETGNRVHISLTYKFVDTQYPSVFTISLISGAIVKWQKTFHRLPAKAGFEWQFYTEEVVIGSGNLQWIVNSSNSHILIENLTVIRTENIQEYTVNPELFDITHTINQQEIFTVNDDFFLVKPIKFKHNIDISEMVFTCTDKDQLEFLKSINGEKIMVRTHDQWILACRINNVEKTYHQGKLGACQTYDVNVALEAI